MGLEDEVCARVAREGGAHVIDKLMTGDRVLFQRKPRAHVVRGFARWLSDSQACWIAYEESLRGHPKWQFRLYADEEGITWCREWDGPAANAFRVKVALT